MTESNVPKPDDEADRTRPSMNKTSLDKQDLEKPEIDFQVEHVDNEVALEGAVPESLRGLSQDEINKLTKKAAIKMDLVIMPCLMIMYIFNYLDRNNIAVAKLAGLTEDLNLSATEYQTSVSILFVGYILMQIPSNMVMNKVKQPGVYLSLAMALWGVVSAASGAVNGFGSLVATRFLVGVAETVFFPGALYYLSIFYNREQYAFRAALLYSGSQLGNAFGGLLSIAILTLDGAHGIQGWRWLFIVEGVVTVGLALIIAMLLPHSPATFRALTPAERDAVMFNFQKDQGQQDDSSEITTMQDFKMAMTDPKTWMLLATLYGISTTASVTNFFPSVVATLGYSRTITYVLTAPPFLLCVVTMLATGFHSDRKMERYWHIVLPLSITVVANIIVISTLNTAARYVAMMLMPTSFFAAYVVTLSWITGILSQPSAKRAVAIAVMTSGTNTANIWTAYLYFGAPRYLVAFIVNIVAAGGSIALATVIRMYLARLNAKMDRGEPLPKSGPTAIQQQRGYRYML